jgi:fructose-1,6-bisphosphatase/inositol monophosphatase family enzyme
MEACAEAARRGGEVLRARWGTLRTIDYKGGIDLVTDADRAAEEELLRFVAERFPGSAVLAEESGSSGSEAAALRWYVDPLDGTTNYAHGVPHFAVNVAVADAAGLAAGATLDPLRGELFVAGRGQAPGSGRSGSTSPAPRSCATRCSAPASPTTSTRTRSRCCASSRPTCGGRAPCAGSGPRRSTSPTSPAGASTASGR